MWNKITDKLPKLHKEDSFTKRSEVVLMTDGHSYYTGYFEITNYLSDGESYNDWYIYGRDGYHFDEIVAWKEIEKYS